MPTFTCRTELPHAPEDVFRWHTRPGALERLLPPWEDMRVVAREGRMDEGGTVTVELRKGPLHLDMTVEHTEYRQGESFRDEQRAGPFRRWSHTHRFLPGTDGGCMVEDVVEYEPPLGSTGGIFAGHVIEEELRKGFLWRHERLASDLARHASLGLGSLTVAVTGSSGLVGRGLCSLLTTGGHRVVRLVRSREAARAEDAVFWNVEEGELDHQRLEGVDAVVHLAGEPIFGVRWTREKKRAIRESRVEGTGLLARGLARLRRPPAVLVTASGVDYYGDRGDRILTEEAGRGEGFLAEVVEAWETAADPARKAGIRVVNLRNGLVVSPEGGAVGTMLLPFKMGVGGRLGSGRQYVSWVDHDDALGIILHAVAHEELAGPVNATSPHPVTNATFTGTLGRVLDRPTVIPVPAFAVKAAFGQMGKELLLDGARARPAKLRDSGFAFHFPGLEESFRFQLGRPAG